MEVPNKVYLGIEELDSGYVYNLSLDNNGKPEYIRKDIVDETIKTAEDHAYFAGKEKLREKLLDWLQKEFDSYPEEIYSNDHYDNGAKDTLKEIINKINSI